MEGELGYREPRGNAVPHLLSESDFAGGCRVEANRRVVDGEFERDARSGARRAESEKFVRLVKASSSASIRRARAAMWRGASRASREALAAVVDARASAPHPAWTRVSARGISGNDLSRKALTSPTTVARVGERQFLRDAEEMALAKRRAALAAEKRALEAAEKARLAALEASNAPPPPPLITEDLIFKAVVVVAAASSAAGLYYS